MDKRQILREIQRTAERNGGAPLGARRFTEETGIKSSHWRGVYWARWGDALREAGFEPNRPSDSFGDQALLESVVTVARQLGHFPTWMELRIAKRADPTLPGEGSFRRAGLLRTAMLAERVAVFCDERDGYEDVLRLARVVSRASSIRETSSDGLREGSVYLLKSGHHYKIGRAFDFGRRGRDISLQLPERPNVVHVIATDDPVGIEAYWHRRFDSKRRNGEWFDLDDKDVNAFKRRRTFM